MKSIDQILEYRRSVRIYDENAEYNSEIIKSCLKRATLAPNSSNLQLWEFYHIQSPEVKKQLAAYCMNQSAARTSNELVVVVTRKDLWKSRAKFNLDLAVKGFDTNDPAKYGKKEKRVFSYYNKLIPNLYKDFWGIYGRLKKLLTFFIGLKRPMYREVLASDVRIVAHKSAALAAQTFMISMAAEGYDTCPMEGFDSSRIKKLLKLPNGAEINMVIACGKRAEGGIYTERRRVDFSEVYKKI